MPCSKESVDRLTMEIEGFLESKNIWDTPYSGLTETLKAERTAIFMELHRVAKKILGQDKCEKLYNGEM